MFEVEHLKYATLATVSRCGMIWFSEDIVEPSMVYENYLSTLSTSPIDSDEEDAGDALARRNNEILPSDAAASAALETQKQVAAILEQYFSEGDLLFCPPSAFTCIPAILNEYRTAELNVRTGCLKALLFVFEYVSPQSAYYCDSVVTMLEDALTDRDLVHRQTASTIVKHLALGVAGLGCEDSMLHLMNLVWPNCFETSPHVIGAVMDAIEAMRVTLGPGVLLIYVLQGLLHPARKVREVYWRIYKALYLGAADALVPFYPDLGELSEGKNVYDRHPLQVFI
ncbi:armadillo-type protein [Lentinula raphanica]|nr:armadillo-type protein [Lentinula raphanica]